MVIFKKFFIFFIFIFSQVSYANSCEIKERDGLYSNNNAPISAIVTYRKCPASGMEVLATAYTSHEGQTDSTPGIAAWGDEIKPGMKIIAVSKDLLEKYGLKRNDKVKISGLPGEYTVLDKMNRKYEKRIDIYFGKDKGEAFKWGKKKVLIQWKIS